MRSIVFWTTLLAVVLLGTTSALAEYGTWEDVYDGAPGLPPGLSNTSFLSIGVGSEQDLYTVGMAQTGAMDMESGWTSSDGGVSFDAMISGHAGGGAACDALRLFQFMLLAKSFGPDTAVMVGMGPLDQCIEKLHANDIVCMFVCLFTMSPIIYWTDNHGATIHTATAPMNILKAPVGMSFSQDDPPVGYIVGGPDLFMRSFDGGATWENLTTLPEKNMPLNGVYFTTANNGYIISGEAEPEQEQLKEGTADEGMQLYLDALNRYRYLHDPVYRMEYRASHPNDLKGLNGKLYHTTDGGQTWELLYSNPNEGFLTLHMVDENIGWLFTEPRPNVYPGFKLYKTFDGGSTWADYTDRIPLGQLNGQGFGLSALTFNPTGQTGFLGGATGVSGLIYKSLLFYTVDSGETWRLDKNLLPWGHPIISFDWATDKIVYEAGFDLSIFKYTQQNLAPIAEAGPDRTAPPNVVIMLDGSASYDPDGDTLTYAWKQTGGPPVQLNGADQAQPTFTATQAERYIFELTVTDSYPESASDTVTITVTKTGGDDDTVTDDDAAPDDDATGDDDAAAGDDDATNHGGDDSSGDNGGCGC